MHGYFPLNKRLTDLSVLSPTAAWAAGAIVSTADDVARFYRALLQGRLLRADLLREMETTVPMGLAVERYGLGLWRTGTIALSRDAVRLRRRLGSQRRLDRLQHERLQQQGRHAPVRPVRQPRRGGVHARDREGDLRRRREGVLRDKRLVTGQPSGALLVGRLRSRGQPRRRHCEGTVRIWPPRLSA